MLTIEQKQDAILTQVAANKDLLTQILTIAQNPATPSGVAEAIAPLAASLADLHTKADTLIAGQTAEAGVLGTDTTSGGTDTTTGGADTTTGGASDTLTGGATDTTTGGASA